MDIKKYTSTRIKDTITGMGTSVGTRRILWEPRK